MKEIIRGFIEVLNEESGLNVVEGLSEIRVD